MEAVQGASAIIQIFGNALKICKDVHAAIDGVRHVDSEIRHLETVLSMVSRNLEDTVTILSKSTTRYRDQDFIRVAHGLTGDLELLESHLPQTARQGPLNSIQVFRSLRGSKPWKALILYIKDPSPVLKRIDRYASLLQWHATNSILQNSEASPEQDIILRDFLDSFSEPTAAMNAPDAGEINDQQAGRTNDSALNLTKRLIRKRIKSETSLQTRRQSLRNRPSTIGDDWVTWRTSKQAITAESIDQMVEAEPSTQHPSELDEVRFQAQAAEHMGDMAVELGFPGFADEFYSRAIDIRQGLENSHGLVFDLKIWINLEIRRVKYAPPHQNKMDCRGGCRLKSLALKVQNYCDRYNSGYPEGSDPLYELRLGVGRILLDSAHFDEAISFLRAALEKGALRDEPRDRKKINYLMQLIRKAYNGKDDSVELMGFEEMIRSQVNWSPAQDGADMHALQQWCRRHGFVGIEDDTSLEEIQALFNSRLESPLHVAARKQDLPKPPRSRITPSSSGGSSRSIDPGATQSSVTRLSFGSRASGSSGQISAGPREEYRKIVQLLAAGNDAINRPGPDGMTALMLAVECSNDIAVSELIHNGAEVDVHNRDGQTLLHICKDATIMELLLQDWRRGSDGPQEMARLNPTVVDRYGRTPLHYACRQANSRVVKALLDNGARSSVHARTTGGETPLLMACLDNQDDVREIVAILREYSTAPISEEERKALKRREISDADIERMRRASTNRHWNLSFDMGG